MVETKIRSIWPRLLMVPGLFLMSIIISAMAAVSEPVEFEFETEDGRTFLHPDEDIHVKVNNADTVTGLNVTGPENFILNHWTEEEDGYSLSFPAPATEGEYTALVHTMQDGKYRNASHGFRVEAFELYIYPEKTTLVSNATKQESSYVYMELVDWKGDPISDLVCVDIEKVYRSELDPDGDARATVVKIFTTMVDGMASFPFTPDPTNRTVLYTFTAYIPGFPSSSCGIIVHPFPLSLHSEREIYSGGGSSLIGPYLVREDIILEVETPGEITELELSDIISDSLEPITQSSPTTMNFTPENASIFQLRLQCTLEESTAELTALIFVNDWTIDLNHPGDVLIGNDLNVSVHRDNGAFFAVRSLLFHTQMIPSQTILEVLESGSSSSPNYEKALLDGSGEGELTFTLPTNARRGEYLLLVGLGSWEEGVDYHGVAVASVNYDRLRIFSPKEIWKYEYMWVSVQERNGNEWTFVNYSLIGGDAEKDEHFGYFISFTEAGEHVLLFSKTGLDVTSHRVMVKNHSITIPMTPRKVLAGHEFDLPIYERVVKMDPPRWDIEPIPPQQVRVKIHRDDSPVQFMDLYIDDANITLNLSKPGLYDIFVYGEDIVSTRKGIEVLGDVELYRPAKIIMSTPYVLGIRRQGKEWPFHTDGIYITGPDGVTYAYDHEQGISSQGLNTIRIYSGPNLLLKETVFVHWKAEGSREMEEHPFMLSVTLLLVFCYWIGISGRKENR